MNIKSTTITFLLVSIFFQFIIITASQQLINNEIEKIEQPIPTVTMLMENSQSPTDEYLSQLHLWFEFSDLEQTPSAQTIECKLLQSTTDDTKNTKWLPQWDFENNIPKQPFLSIDKLIKYGQIDENDQTLLKFSNLQLQPTLFHKNATISFSSTIGRDSTYQGLKDGDEISCSVEWGNFVLIFIFDFSPNKHFFFFEFYIYKLSNVGPILI
jgi:hypothetical protein